jgi:hypothetical protein
MKIKYTKDHLVLASWISGEEAPSLFSMHVAWVLRKKRSKSYWSIPLIGCLVDILVIDGDYFTSTNSYPSEFRRVVLLVTEVLVLQTSLPKISYFVTDH